MHPIRVLIFCLAVLAIIAQPSRAAPVCPMLSQATPAVGHHLHRITGHADAGHRACPERMACCAPAAVQAAAPASMPPTIWRVSPPSRPLADRDREDAAHTALRRPPRSA